MRYWRETNWQTDGQTDGRIAALLNAPTLGRAHNNASTRRCHTLTMSEIKVLLVTPGLSPALTKCSCQWWWTFSFLNEPWCWCCSISQHQRSVASEIRRRRNAFTYFLGLLTSSLERYPAYGTELWVFRTVYTAPWRTVPCRAVPDPVWKSLNTRSAQFACFSVSETAFLRHFRAQHQQHQQQQQPVWMDSCSALPAPASHSNWQIEDADWYGDETRDRVYFMAAHLHVNQLSCYRFNTTCDIRVTRLCYEHDVRPSVVCLYVYNVGGLWSHSAIKLAFHDTDTDIPIDILARIVARISACRSAYHRKNLRKSR